MDTKRLKLPHFTPPPQSCDTHCHVFGPSARFPYSKLRKYTPEDAPKQQLFNLHKNLGFERSVLVQASCHGTDNSAMIDMLNDSEGRCRGIAMIDESFTKHELKQLHESGVRGVRFNFLTRLVATKTPEYYLNIANMVADLGWHVVVYFEPEHLSTINTLLRKLPCPLVIDHMGRPDVSLPIDDASFQKTCSLLSDNPLNRIKVSCIERLSKQGYPYSDATPFAKYLVNHFSDQVLWGTDWPHPNMGINVPDDALLVNSIPQIATTVELQKKLLVDNPHTLYCFED